MAKTETPSMVCKRTVYRQQTMLQRRKTHGTYSTNVNIKGEKGTKNCITPHSQAPAAGPGWVGKEGSGFGSVSIILEDGQEGGGHSCWVSSWGSQRYRSLPARCREGKMAQSLSLPACGGSVGKTVPCRSGGHAGRPTPGSPAWWTGVPDGHAGGVGGTEIRRGTPSESTCRSQRGSRRRAA